MTGAARRRRLQVVRRRTEIKRDRARNRLAVQDVTQLQERIERDMGRIRLARSVEAEKDRMAADAAVSDVNALLDELDQWPIDPNTATEKDVEGTMQHLCSALNWTRERLMETLVLTQLVLDYQRSKGIA